MDDDEENNLRGIRSIFPSFLFPTRPIIPTRPSVPQRPNSQPRPPLGSPTMSPEPDSEEGDATLPEQSDSENSLGSSKSHSSMSESSSSSSSSSSSGSSASGGSSASSASSASGGSSSFGSFSGPGDRPIIGGPSGTQGGEDDPPADLVLVSPQGFEVDLISSDNPDPEGRTDYEGEGPNGEDVRLVYDMGSWRILVDFVEVESSVLGPNGDYGGGWNVNNL